MKRIDINACFGHWQYWDLHHKTPAELVALMDRLGIDRALVTSLRGVFVDWRAGNEEALAAAANHPNRLIAAVTLSPFMDGGAGELERLIAAGARAVRLYPTFHSYRLDSAFVDEICRTAADGGVPVMIGTRIMMNWRFVPIATETIGDVVRRNPRTQFILSGQNYLAEFQSLVRLMQQSPNCCYEISCMQGFGAVARLVGQVGADRVLFGTGAVLHYPACNVAKLDGADLATGVREAIAWRNAAKLLHLS
jgi:predicted TIM-barrel fold metal-dependent hydrolase